MIFSQGYLVRSEVSRQPSALYFEARAFQASRSVPYRRVCPIYMTDTMQKDVTVTSTIGFRLNSNSCDYRVPHFLQGKKDKYSLLWNILTLNAQIGYRMHNSIRV